MLSTPQQSSFISDKDGRPAALWWRLFNDLVSWTNKRTSQQLASRVEHTGTADDTSVASMAITTGTRGVVRLSIALTMTANANAKTVTVKIGGSTAQTYTLDNAASAVISLCIVGMGNNKQTCYTTGLTGATVSGEPVALTTADLSATSTIAIYMQLGTITDTIALESYALDLEQI
jgi:hypothetical protein